MGVVERSISAQRNTRLERKHHLNQHWDRLQPESLDLMDHENELAFDEIPAGEHGDSG